MQTVDGYAALDWTCAHPSAVGIGVFDGLHLGHQALIRRVVDLARAHGLRPVAYTFAPHPARLFAPERAPALIEPIACRLERLEALGIDCTVIEPFNQAFASHSAHAFVHEILHRALAAKHVVVGAGFAFGHKQMGRVALLHQLGPALGFQTHPVTHIETDGGEVSSTRIRGLVRTGDIAGATRLLARPFMLVGRVVKGAQRGSQLGFPTANLAADNELRPKAGVYGAWAQGAFGQARCVVNIGTNPTFESGDVLKIEAHLLEHSGPSFYDTPMRLHLTTRLRDERRFDGIDALKTQIARDIAQARQIISGEFSI